MSLPPEAKALLARIVIVLNEPQNVVNIAAVIRGMKNMGLSRLRLVRPADFDGYRIGGIAHRTDEIVEGTQIFDTLQEATAGALMVAGTSARARTAGRNYQRPREAAAEILERAGEGEVVIVLGREDRGLTNEELDLCHQVVIVPTDPEYSSLNLAQAALILMYELLVAAGGSGGELPRGRRATAAATNADLEEMYTALEQGLGRIEFYKARKAESVMRTLRTILGQARMDQRESRLIRGIGYEIGHYIDRLGRSEEEDPS